MKYKRFRLEDRGYFVQDGAWIWDVFIPTTKYEVKELFGLDGKDDQRFFHRGYSYPNLYGITEHYRIENDGWLYLAYEGELEGGESIEPFDKPEVPDVG